MSENDELITQPRLIPGYTYGTPAAARSPLTLEELEQLKQAAGLTDDERALRMAGEVLSGHADEMVADWRARIAEHPHLIGVTGSPMRQTRDLARRQVSTDCSWASSPRGLAAAAACLRQVVDAVAGSWCVRWQAVCAVAAGGWGGRY